MIIMYLSICLKFEVWAQGYVSGYSNGIYMFVLYTSFQSFDSSVHEYIQRFVKMFKA